ncbi:MAG: TonB-dependent receptor [Xanthomonadaceae bacterium]|nr:TonB-dependent receptor [Xanthomonadaceae bacterium]
MTFKTNKLRNAITLAIAGTSALAGTGVAFAQDSGKDGEELDTITVTGSRIVRRAESETQQPIFELTREDIQAQGLTSVGDVIQNITANGSTLNTTYNNGGNGETRVSLRNLGSNRTLVLVNGRRWVAGTGLGGAVDLNTIPTAAVERIEVLKDGASVIYGSDAIAGVVNVILRTDYQGAEFNAYVGEFTDGDGTRQSYDLTIGTSDDRFSAMFGMGYVKEDPVMAGDREISSEPIIGTGLFFGSSTLPGGRFAVCNGTFANGVCSGGTQTRPDGTAGQFTYAPGAVGNAWGPYTTAYNFAPDNYLITPQERKSLFGRASLNLTDNTRVFITGTYNNRRSEQLLAAMPIVLGTGPGAGAIARTIAISPDSIYNPFGRTVSRVQRRAVETGGRSFAQNVDTFGFNGGIEGSFELGDRYFTWDAGMVYGRNDQNDTTNGLFNLLALRQSLGPSMIDPATSRPICVTTPGNAATAITGCVPLNLLGGVGSITPEMLAFSSFVAHDEFGYKMKQYYANVSGEIVELPGGMLSFAFGMEHRTESGFDQPDALIASGNTTGNSRTPTKGGYKLDEAYLELAIPLLRDVVGAQELEFSIAGRYSDYSNFGDVTNGKVGFKWRPIKDLMVRGNWSEGFRAPSIAELFSGVADSFPGLADPCSTTFGGAWAGLSATERAACVAQGVPNVGYDQGNAQIRISVGGNPELKAESSETKTLGLVWSPSFLEGFNVSLDWWKIELEDAIVTRSGQFILNACIRDNPNDLGRPRNALDDQVCALAQVRRDPTGQITNLLSIPQNTGRRTLEGYDMTINYNLPENVLGNFGFTLDTTYMAENSSDIDTNGFISEYADRSNNWRVRANLMTRWTKGDWGATWFTRYYSRQTESCETLDFYGFGDLCSDPANIENKLGGTTYHDATVFWKAPWNAKITLGVNNIFSKDPPVSFTTFANSFDPAYEIPGRFVYMQYNQKF